MFFLFEEIRETFLGFSQGNVRVLKTRSAIFGGYLYKMIQYSRVNVKSSNS